jgi:hypothetical protein
MRIGNGVDMLNGKLTTKAWEYGFPEIGIRAEPMLQPSQCRFVVLVFESYAQPTKVGSQGFGRCDICRMLDTVRIHSKAMIAPIKDRLLEISGEQQVAKASTIRLASG